MILCGPCYQKRDLPPGGGRSWFWGKRQIDRWGEGLAEVTTCNGCGQSTVMKLFTEYDPDWKEVSKPKFYKISPQAIEEGKRYMEKRETDKLKQQVLMEKIRLYRLNNPNPRTS